MGISREQSHPCIRKATTFRDSNSPVHRLLFRYTASILETQQSFLSDSRPEPKDKVNTIGKRGLRGPVDTVYRSFFTNKPKPDLY